MLKIFIAEDEKGILNSIIKVIEDYCPDTSLSGYAQTVSDAVLFLQENSIDLLLLDINFPDGSGFDILKRLNSYNFKVIFITAYEKYALQAIKFSAADYLLKPLNPKELISSVQKLQNDGVENLHDSILIETLLSNLNTANKTKKISLKTSERINIIEIKDIIRCESDSSYTTFYLNDKKKIVVSKPLKEYDEILSDSGFIRTHKSHLINIDFIKSFERSGGGYIVLKDKTNIPVSIRKKDSVLKAIQRL